MYWQYLTALALLAKDASAQGGSGAMFRFACSQLVIERLDPLVTPGQNPSPHVHQIVGGNAFNVTVSHHRHQSTSCSQSDVVID